MTPDEPSALERLRRLEAEERAQRAGRSTAGGAPTDRPAGTPPKRGLLAGLLASVLLFLAKGKALLVILATKGGLLLSALKLGKLATTFGTMAVSLWFYARLYPWTFALGLVVLILVHEMGHGVAAMRLGLRVGAPIFIPGFGAVIALKDQPRSTWMNAVVGYGGPLAGSLGGLVVFVAGPLFFPGHEGFCAALAHVTFLLNLFNLLPVGGLDGDRITEPLTLRLWLLGLAATLVVAALSLSGSPHGEDRGDPQLVFALAILALGAWKAVRVHRRRTGATPTRLVDRVAGPEAKYTEEHDVTDRQRTAAAIAYFGLVALLAVLSSVSVPAAR